MLELNRLMVVIDTDHETQFTLDRVAQLATVNEFKLRLISCDYSRYLLEGYYFDGLQLPALREEYLRDRQQALDALAAPLLEQGMDVEVDAIWGHPPYQAIVHAAMQWQPDLLLHSTRRHSRLSRLFLSNEDWQLVRSCPCPLLLVKDKTWTEKPKMIAAVDPMHSHGKPLGLDHKIIQVTKALAGKLAGSVHVLHAFSEHPLSGTYPIDAEKQHQQAMDVLMQDFDLATDQVSLVSRPVEEALPDLQSDLDADLVVMGAISRTFLSEAVIGNTAEKVLDYLASDVLIVKPDGFVTPIASR